MFLATILLLPGCAVGPNYHRPAVNAPAAFRGDTRAVTNSFADLPWWQVFHDDNLQALIRTALTNNYDLRIAVTRVDQARALAAEARSEYFPQADYAALASRGRNAVNGSVTPSVKTQSTYALDASASWEIDLWGRVRRLTESARAQYYASQEARRDVQVSLIAQVAQDYFQLLALDRELQIARDTTNSFGDSFKIFDERLRGGIASKLETSSAEALMDSAAATIPELERQIILQENQICVLLGRNPGPVPRPNASLDAQSPPEVPPGLPSTLLERRPDVREAEQNLRSANAQVGVAVANFFPQLSLTGLYGQVSPELSLLTAGSANAWSYAANLAGPLFHSGLVAEYHGVKALRQQYLLQYQQAVLNAFQEVSDALVSREKYAAEHDAQSRAVDAYQEAVKISLDRYRLGSASYYEVLQEQQLLFPAENSLVQARLNQLLSTVQLYSALGGGWTFGK
jgi:multidrug efflux system outer membrane protein